MVTKALATTALLLITLFLMIGLAVAQAARQQATARSYTVLLDGPSEAPGPGDPDGAGRATVTLNPGRRQACVTIRVSGTGPPTAAHIHRGLAGTAGPVVVPLSTPAEISDSIYGSANDCVTISPAVMRELLRSPERFYVNVHSAAYPAGAVRGQLAKKMR
jgi:CHRD domain-containing protein